jgi:hypothetical protein
MNSMANIIVFALIALIALVRAQTITTTNSYAPVLFYPDFFDFFSPFTELASPLSRSLQMIPFLGLPLA